MNHRLRSLSRRPAVFLGAFALLLAASCGGDANGTPTPVPTTPSVATAAPTQTAPALTIPQSDGQTLILETPPRRIVSLSPHATEILCTLGAGDRLVAVEKFANCPAGSKARPALDAFQPSVEAIAGYEPDLVYVFSDAGGIVESLRRLEIPVLYLELPTTVDGVLEQISLFGRISAREAEAESLGASLRGRIDAVRGRLTGVSGPRIFHELDPSYFTVGPGSFVGDLYVLLGAENIAAATGEAYPQLTAEAIISADPEVIVLADEESGVTPETVRQRPGWDAVAAVKNGRVCVIDPSLVSQPGTRVAEALETLATCLYPEHFS